MLPQFSTDSEKLAYEIVKLSERVKVIETGDKTPLGMANLIRSSNQSIPNGIGSKEPIQFESQNAGVAFTWAIGTPTKIYLVPQRTNVRIQVFGSITFSSNNTGSRAAHLLAYTALDVLRDTIALKSELAADGIDHTISFCVPYQFTDPSDYLVFTVSQSSGGALNVSYATIGILVTR